MNKILRVGLFLLLLCVHLPMFAQISVKSFIELENDLDASTNFIKKDINGKSCAIIKIFTTQKGFSFDNGQLGIVATEQKTAEIWVYVPEGTMKLKISHQQLGHIANAEADGYYWFPDGRVKAGCVYKMELITGEVRMVVEQAKVQTGWLVFNSTPEGAEVYLSENDEEEKHIGTTPLNKKMPYGRYVYRAKMFNYHDEVGVAVVDKARLDVNLQMLPAYGSVSVNSTPAGAKVYLNGKDTGKKTPCVVDEVSSGNYELKLQLQDYAPGYSRVDVKDGQTATVNLTLEARYAIITINSLPGATIKVNGNEVGHSSCKTNLVEGIYDVEVSLASHETVTKQIEVEANVPQTIELNPIPIYGSLDVVSEPIDADVIIDGISYGITPMSIDNILIGDYGVTLKKSGYVTATKRVSITKGNSASIDVKLQKEETDNSITSLSNGSQHKKDVQKKTENMINLIPNWNQNVTSSQRAVLERLISNMVKVEGGTFTMGATKEQGKDADSDEKPAHQVTLSDYYIGKYEVTQKEWQAVMGNNPSYKIGENLPVEQVSWNDCQEFIRKLNGLTGMNFRLPTEAEWEYVARGGKQSKGYKYSGSNNIGDVAWYFGNSGSKTHIVGIKQPNELGIYDMSGNVDEWCSDWYGKYSSYFQTNPIGSSSGTYRVLRGGSWYYNASNCRVANRNYNSPSYRFNLNGFRVVLVP